jgi:hypothetical protein
MMGLNVLHHLSMKAGSEDFTLLCQRFANTLQSWFLSRARLAVKLTILLNLQFF